MLANTKRVYTLGTYQVENRRGKWYYRNAYADDEWHGAYGSEHSVCLMIARALRKELLKRDAVHILPE